MWQVPILSLWYCCCNLQLEFWLIYSIKTVAGYDEETWWTNDNNKQPRVGVAELLPHQQLLQLSAASYAKIIPGVVKPQSVYGLSFHYYCLIKWWFKAYGTSVSVYFYYPLGPRRKLRLAADVWCVRTCLLLLPANWSQWATKQRPLPGHVTRHRLMHWHCRRNAFHYVSYKPNMLHHLHWSKKKSLSMDANWPEQFGREISQTEFSRGLRKSWAGGLGKLNKENRLYCWSFREAKQ